MENKQLFTEPYFKNHWRLHEMTEFRLLAIHFGISHSSPLWAYTLTFFNFEIGFIRFGTWFGPKVSMVDSSLYKKGQFIEVVFPTFRSEYKVIGIPDEKNMFLKKLNWYEKLIHDASLNFRQYPTIEQK